MLKATIYVSLLVAAMFGYFAAKVHFQQFIPLPDPQVPVDILVNSIDLVSMDAMAQRRVEDTAKLIVNMNRGIIENHGIACNRGSTYLFLATALFFANGIILWIHNKRLKADGVNAAA